MNFAPFAVALAFVIVAPTPQARTASTPRAATTHPRGDWRPFAAGDSLTRPDTTLRDTTLRDTTGRDTLLKEKPKPKPKRPKPGPRKP